MGRIILTAAAKHLTPVTLELGGKSPCIIDADVDTDVVANRIIWGKFVNLGQTCIAPDYLLVDKSIKDKLVSSLKNAIQKQYTENPQTCPNYARIVNKHHFSRLKSVFDSQIQKNASTVVIGGVFDEKDLYISPTLLLDVGMDLDSNPIMQDEIFGPLLPILEYNHIDEAISYVNSRYIQTTQTILHVEEIIH